MTFSDNSARRVCIESINGPTTVQATLNAHNEIVIQETREIPTPNNQTLEEWFSDISSEGWGLEQVRVTTTYSGSVELTGWRPANHSETEQLKEHFSAGYEED